MFASSNRMKKIVFLLLGTNLGDRKKNLTVARNGIEAAVGSIIKISSIYQTAAWGKTDQPEFLNQALGVETLLSPYTLLDEVLKIEIDMGRRREEKWGERIIDIDILLYEDQMVNSHRLTIPHLELQNRRFALVPLTEIAATVTHPVFQKTIQELLELCPDELRVTPFTQ